MDQEQLPDFMIDDCWGHMLDYVSRKDLLEELEGTRCGRLRIETITNVWDEEEQQRRRKCRILIIKDTVDLNAVLQRWGRLVAELYYDGVLADERILRNLGSACPNLQDITFVRLKWHSSSCGWAESFTKLKRVCFENCSIVDGCVSELIKNNNIEELVFRMTDTITGSFLLTGDDGAGGGDLTKLNTLVLSRCSDLILKYLQSAVEPVNYLTGVRKLEMRDLPSVIHMKAHLILEKMPQLEHLTFDCTEDLLRADVVAAVSQLGRLQHLGLVNGKVLRGHEIQIALHNWMSKPTILEVLNEDCWGLVLGLLRTEDIVRSERVSRGWQRVILRYLEDASFSIVEGQWYSRQTTRKYRILKMKENNLASLTAKWGACVKKAVCVLTEDNVRVLFTDCPNLEDVKFYGSPVFLKVCGVGLQRTLKSPFQVRFTASNKLELAVLDSERTTGQCSESPLTSNLRSLCMERCEKLQFRHLVSAVDLRGLRKLELIHSSTGNYLHMLPELEELSLHLSALTQRMNIRGELAESLGRLRLRRLVVTGAGATDAWLEAASRGFGQLAELHLEGCPDVTARGVLAACGAARGALRELNVASNRTVQDQHVEEILRVCPNLERLNVSSGRCLATHQL